MKISAIETIRCTEHPNLLLAALRSFIRVKYRAAASSGRNSGRSGIGASQRFAGALPQSSSMRKSSGLRPSAFDLPERAASSAAR